MNVWILVMGLFTALDVLTTWIGLRAGRVEANPLMGLLLAHGELGMVALKLGAILLIVRIVKRASREHQRLWRLWMVPVALTGAAVANNVLVFVGR